MIDAQLGDLEADATGARPVSTSARARSHARLALVLLLVAVAYYGAGIVAVALRLEPGSISTIWLPQGVLLAALMLTPVRHWWLYLAALLPVHLHLVSHHQGPEPLAVVLAQYGGNMAQALLGALAVRRFLGTPPRLDEFQRMAAFLGLGVILPVMAVSALVAALFVATGWVDGFSLAWHRRTLSQVCGSLALTPLIIQLAAGGVTSIRATGRLRALEFAAITLGLLALLAPALGWERTLAIQYALLFAPLPLLLWIAVRFGPGALSLQLLIVMLAALTATQLGHAPFAAETVTEGVLSAQGFLLSIAIPLLLLAALVAERNWSAQELGERLQFERLVSELSASLMNPPRDQADQEIGKALGKVLVAMDLDRCSVYEYHPEQRCCRITHSAETAACPLVRREPAESELPWLLRQLRAGATVVLSDVERDLPVEADAERRYAAGYGSRSWVAVPALVGGGVVRGVSYHSIRQRHWSVDLVSRLQLLAEILVSAVTSRQAQAALRESEERLRLALAAGRMGAWDCDLRRGTVAWSREHFAIMGLLPHGVKPTQELWANRVHPDDLPRANAALSEAIAQRREYRCEYRVVWPDGTIRWAEACAAPVYDETGECVRVMGLIVDTTERKRAAQALQASEERYRAVVESQTELVCRYLPDTTLTFVNEAYCRFFGRRREELIGRRFVELIPEPARPATLDHVASLVRHPRVCIIEHEVLLPDRSVGWQQWVDSSIAGADGRVTELQGIGRDITDRKRAEEANQRLAHASRLVVMGELTASIAHEINQPLGAILANADAADLMLEGGAGRLDEVRRILADIRRDDLRASDVIQRMRDLLRKRAPECEPLDVNEMIAGVLRLLVGDAERRGVAVETEFAPGLPAALGDRGHLQQVLLNLLMNGMEAMADTPAAGRRLSVGTARRDGAVEVEIMDRGHGLDPAHLSDLFESFFTTKKDGLGLGLSIARSIVEAHGGRIWAEYRPGGGAIFRFTLPAENAA